MKPANTKLELRTSILTLCICAAFLAAEASEPKPAQSANSSKSSSAAPAPAKPSTPAKPEVGGPTTDEGLADIPIGRERKEPQPPPPKGPPIPPPPNVAAPPADATKSSSGLAYMVLRKGTGAKHPAPTDLITVHYTGWRSSDGAELDSSVQRGTPLTAALDKMMKGWREGVAGMVAGEKRRLWIPQDLAFEGNPSAPMGMMVYDVELLSFKTGPAVPPPDVSAPPAGAARNPSGLSWRQLDAGTGKAHPAASARVRIHYTGWDPSGKMVDSSVARGAPVEITLGTGIKGWTEALQSMVEGERRRIWVPAKLAFLGQTGRPQTDLVYDLELIKILQ